MSKEKLANNNALLLLATNYQLLDRVEDILPKESPTRKDLIKLQQDAGIMLNPEINKEAIENIKAGKASGFGETTTKLITQFEEVTNFRMRRVLLSAANLVPANPLKTEFRSFLTELNIDRDISIA